MSVLEVIEIDFVNALLVLFLVLISGALASGFVFVVSLIKSSKEDYDEYCDYYQQCSEDLDRKKPEPQKPGQIIGTCKHCGAPLSDNVCGYCNCRN